jgi:leucyl aminopeptidase (aminopeptidase T)
MKMSAEAASFGTEYDTGVRAWRALELGRVAHRIVTVNSWIQPSETVVIVCDPEVSPLIIEALATQVYVAGGLPVVLTFPGQGVHGEDLPPAVAAAMKAADVVYAAVSKSITHTVALQDARKAGVRYLGFSNITEDAFVRGAASADPNVVRKIGEKVRDKLFGCANVRVTSELGTDLRLSLEGRHVRVRNGIIPREYEPVHGKEVPDNGRMFPDGETNCCPVEESVNGTFVIDRWIQGIGVLSEPVTWTFKDGECVDIAGGIEADRLVALLERDGDEHSRNVGEFAVGINPSARLDGNPHREGKKILGSVHLALGTGIPSGGRFQSTLHLDGLISPPRIYADDTLFLEDGKLVV